MPRSRHIILASGLICLCFLALVLFSGPSLKPVADAYTTPINEATFRLIAAEKAVQPFAVNLLLSQLEEEEQVAHRHVLKRAVISLRMGLFHSDAQIHAFVLENARFGPGVTGIADAARLCFNSAVGDLSAADAAVLMLHMRAPRPVGPEDAPSLLQRRNDLLQQVFAEQDGTALLAQQLALPLQYCPGSAREDA